MDIFTKKEPEHVTLLNHGRLPLVAMFTTLVVGIAAGFSLANGVEVQQLTARGAADVAVFDGIGGPTNKAKIRAARAASPEPTVTVTVAPGAEAVVAEAE